MMEEIRSLEDLLDLQREDSDIDRLLERRQSLPELEEYRAAHERVTDLDAELQEISGRLRDLDLGVDKAEGELQMGEEKLQREERRLFAGGLSAKEAEHLRQEVEMLRRRSSEAETEILELMEHREQAQHELAGLEAERREADAVKTRLQGSIQAEWKGIDVEIARHEAKKAELAPLIPTDLMDLYEQLRPAKEGVAVGRLAEGICGGCHLALSAAERSQVLAEDPPRCLHCRRILVPQ
jgi:predicted  nucleic acid-binding Zn-ribbon protein